VAKQKVPQLPIRDVYGLLELTVRTMYIVHIKNKVSEISEKNGVSRNDVMCSRLYRIIK
jgi:hypothetical protein